jgi:hypothetical protein
MQLKIDNDGRNLLDDTIRHYYKIDANREAKNFLHSKDDEWGWFYTHYLLDKKVVIRYGIGEDRGMCVGGIQLAIGPHYFSPADFWSYENSTRFTIEASTEGVLKNLRLLDEFLGYPVKPLFTP